MGKNSKKKMDRIPSTTEVNDNASISSFEKVSLHSAEPSERDSPTPSDTQQPSEELVMARPSAGEDEITPAEEDTAPTSSQTTANAPFGASPSGRSIDPVVRELEEAAAVAAAATAEAAAAAKQKLLQGAAGAKAFMSSLWSAFDDPSSASARSQQSEAELKSRLGLEDTEQIFEVFRCKIIQSYSPTNNDFTPPKNIAFSGLLHIASAHICFEFDGAGGTAKPVSIHKKEIKKVSRDGDVLKVELVGNNKELVLGAFSLPKLEVESAYTLLMSLCEDG